jgi:hypothetical protein
MNYLFDWTGLPAPQSLLKHWVRMRKGRLICGFMEMNFGSFQGPRLHSVIFSDMRISG